MPRTSISVPPVPCLHGALDIDEVGQLLRRLSGTRETWGELRLDRLVKLLLDIDEPDARELEQLLQARPDVFARSAPGFYSVLLDAIRELGLQRLFCASSQGEFHRSVCPAAYDERAGEIHPLEMEQWRAEFRAMAPERQMIAATIIWLYQSGSDSTWLRRVPCSWRADEALHYLYDTGVLAQWIRLIARFPGW
ncbi:hypothetical protein QML88_22200 [Serratia sp. Se-RSmG]|nr:hypothetical protein [Serratia sp. Se-RSmG]MDI6949513.1 hypothetical protein [Serratia sp. Se-RSmG]